MKTGLQLISEERKEQIEKHGRTKDNDIKSNADYQLSFAAISIAHPMADVIEYDPPTGWNADIFRKMKNKPYRDRLIIAGALIAAEIDRISDNKPR